MIWVRKAVVHLLALILLISLVGGVLATSINMNLGHPAKLEGWLQQSNLYGNFVSTVITQSQKSVGDNDQTGAISLSDTAVQQAAQSVFSPQVLQGYVSTFLDSNYAWLEGKTPTPNFTIDLTDAKQSFAQQIGQYVQTYFSGLPVCSTAQLAAFPNIDPLTAPCRPQQLTAAAEGANAAFQISHSTDFLSNPVITATSLNPNSTAQQSQPYYKKLSFAPRVYRLATKVPLLLALVSLLSAVGIIFIAPRKRKGLRRVGSVTLLAGLILIAIKFITDAVLPRVETKIFNKSSIGQLQQALTNFAHHVESGLVKTDFYFGIAFVVIALVIFIVLISTRNRDAKPPKEQATDDQPAPADEPEQPLQLAKPVNRRAAIDLMGPSIPKMAAPASKPAPKPKPQQQPSSPKRTRLIQ